MARTIRNIRPVVKAKHNQASSRKTGLFQSETLKSRWRIHLCFFLFMLAAGCVTVKLYYLQIVKGDYYEALAMGQQTTFEEDQGLRGDIYLADNGFPLTQAKTRIILYVFPSKISPADFSQESQKIAEVIGEPKEDWLGLFNKGNSIKRELTEEQATKIKGLKLGSVTLDKVRGRYYPQKDFAANTIGFLGPDNRGQYGLEGFYDEILRGNSSIAQGSRSPFGYLTLTAEDKKQPQKGADLWLTLDNKIQYLAEKLLKKAKEDWNIDSGQIIVQEPSTGKILVMANFPTFDPNNYSASKDLEVFSNRAIQKTFEPGSVFKPITMAGGLQEGLVTPETTFVDTGSLNVGGPSIYNFNKHVFGKSTMTYVLEQSINTGAAFVENKLGSELFLKYVARFGFFEKTGIDLQGEVFSTNETLRRGYPRDFATASFGQGIEITPLQILQAFSAIANQGQMMKPYIVAKIVKPNGEELVTQPHVVKEVVSAKVAADLAVMMEKVVSQGSGRRAKIIGYQISGKTGTAQVITNGKYDESVTTQTFLGFFPTQEPRATIIVKLDSPKGSSDAGSSATPIAREMIKNMLDLWQIPPTEGEL